MKITLPTVTRFVSVLAVAAASLSFSSPAVAASLPGMAGHAWIPSEQACFASAWSQIFLTSSCNSQPRKWLIPVPMTSGSHTFSINAVPGAPLNVLCRVVVNDASNNLIWQSATTQFSGTLGTQSIPAGATAHFDCDLMGTGTVRSVSY